MSIKDLHQEEEYIFIDYETNQLQLANISVFKNKVDCWVVEGDQGHRGAFAAYADREVAAQIAAECINTGISFPDYFDLYLKD